MILVGNPGTAKTGGLVALANAGFKLRVLDLDQNIDPLLRFCTPEGLKNIDAVQLENELRYTASGMEYEDKAFMEAVRLTTKEWSYTDSDGELVNLGKPSEWGLDTVVVLDSTTAHSEICKHRALKLMNKSFMHMSQPVWGFAQKLQLSYIEKMTSLKNRFNFIAIAHQTMIGPKEIAESDNITNRGIKEEVADLMPTRYFPSAVGRKAPQEIGTHFPIILHAVAKRGKLVYETITKDEIDLKVPTPNLPKELDIADGLLTVFKALGINPPNTGV
jgi:hypothetical protein